MIECGEIEEGEKKLEERRRKGGGEKRKGGGRGGGRGRAGERKEVDSVEEKDILQHFVDKQSNQ